MSDKTNAISGAAPVTRPRLTGAEFRRLLLLRTLAVPGPAICILVAGQVVDLSIRPLPLIMIVLILLASNVWLWQRYRNALDISNGVIFGQIVLDIFGLASILYYSGGASNPFAFFFLLPIVVAATTLPKLQTWAIAIIAVACYTGLRYVSAPLPLLMDGAARPDFGVHVGGMWLGFVLCAGLIAHYVAGIGQALHDRDNRLARAREKALNDQHVVALATLAAGAAHELGTPLTIMAVLVDEMAQETRHAGSEPRRLDILQQQIDRCRDALHLISDSAGAHRAGDTRVVPLNSLLQQVVQDVLTLRPAARIELDLAPGDSVPGVVVEYSIQQSISNVIHNAVDASPDNITITADYDASRVRIHVSDRGPGVPADADLESNGAGGKTGLGVGLIISRAAVARYGGRITLAERDGGGTIATIELPTAAAIECGNPHTHDV